MYPRVRLPIRRRSLKLLLLFLRRRPIVVCFFQERESTVFSVLLFIQRDLVFHRHHICTYLFVTPAKSPFSRAIWRAIFPLIEDAGRPCFVGASSLSAIRGFCIYVIQHRRRSAPTNSPRTRRNTTLSRSRYAASYSVGVLS